MVIPGFVDAHTHPVFAGNRADEFEMRAAGKSYQEIAASGGGISSTVLKTRAASEDELFAASKRYCEWFMRAGTTTIKAKSGYGLTLEDEMKMLRVIRRLDQRRRWLPTFLGAHAVPDEYKDTRSAYVDLIVNEMIPIIAREGLARFCDVFCESGAFDVDESRRILQARFSRRRSGARTSTRRKTCGRSRRCRGRPRARRPSTPRSNAPAPASYSAH